MSQLVSTKERAANLCAIIANQERKDGAIAKMLPKAMGMPVERFLMMAYSAIQQTPLLAESTPASVIAALWRSAQAGLEIDGVHGALVPFKDHGVSKAQFVPMYRGLIRLAMNSGLVASCQVPRLVYQGDVFDYEYGLHETLRHVPSADPSNRVEEKIEYGYWIVTLVSGERVWDVFPRAVFDATKNRSRAKNGPWSTDYGPMCQKTTVRLITKYLPTASAQAELQRVVTRDERLDAGIADELEAEVEAKLTGSAPAIGRGVASLADVAPEPEERIIDAPVIEPDNDPGVPPESSGAAPSGELEF